MSFLVGEFAEESTPLDDAQEAASAVVLVTPRTARFAKLTLLGEVTRVG